MKDDILVASQHFLSALETKRPEASKLLRGAQTPPEAAFQEFQKSFDFPFPEDLRTFYGILNGYHPNDYVEEKEIVPNLYLLPFKDSIKQYEKSWFGPEHDQKEWILLSDSGGEVIFRKLTPQNIHDETLYIRNREANLEDWSLYDGIAQMLETMATCLDAEAYQSPSEKDQIRIALKYNPNSRYWQHSARVFGINSADG